MSSLNQNAEYEELVSVRLVGMMLSIIVRHELRKRILRYSTYTVGTGALNILVIFCYFMLKFCQHKCNGKLHSIST